MIQKIINKNKNKQLVVIKCIIPFLRPFVKWVLENYRTIEKSQLIFN